jgi:ketosteroid isomerase-like protein
MATETSQATAEAEIRARLNQWAKALRTKDLAAIMAAHAPDVLAFDCHSRLQMKGADAYRAHLEACLPCIQGWMTFEIHDLDITAEGGVGFCHYLARCGAAGADGKEHSSWFRGTACLRRTSGTWQIVHGHFSAPFDPASGKAMLDLEPEHTERASAA